MQMGQAYLLPAAIVIVMRREVSPSMYALKSAVEGDLIREQY